MSVSGREIVDGKNFRRFLRYLTRHWKLAALGGGLMAASIGLQLPMPLLTMHLLDHVVPEKSVASLNLIGLLLLAFLAFKAAATYGESLLLVAFRNRVMFDVRRDVFFHLEHLPLAYFEARKTGYLTSRVSSDVRELQGLMANTILTVIRDLLTFMVGLGLLFWLNWKLAIMAVAILPFYVYWLRRWNPRVRGLRREGQERQARVTGDLLETLSGIYLVKAFLAERRELVKMLRSLKRALGTEYEATRSSSIMLVGAILLSSLGKLALIWFGCWQIMVGGLTLGGFVAFNSFLRYLFDPANSLVTANAGIQQSLAAMDRLFEILDEPREHRLAGVKATRPVRGHIEFAGLRFSYDGEHDVLHGIDLRVEAGSTVAIVGPSGAGKSTLLNLLMGFYPFAEGRITLDGIDVRQADLRWLRRQFAVVPQDTFLFSGDVWSNLRYGDPKASREAMVRAAKLANAHDFITALPRGYDTEIGERAVRLSGGQKQRLMIAMAFLRDAPVLILDEATSSVDSVTEKTIQEALERLTANRTTFIIAHRLNTVRRAGVIVVMDGGRIVETGTHGDLMRESGVYHRLYSQTLAA